MKIKGNDVESSAQCLERDQPSANVFFFFMLTEIRCVSSAFNYGITLATQSFYKYFVSPCLAWVLMTQW